MTAGKGMDAIKLTLYHFTLPVSIQGFGHLAHNTLLNNETENTSKQNVQFLSNVLKRCNA